MEKVHVVISCLLLAVAGVTAQTGQRDSGRLVPQWLSGLTAMTIFLLLTFMFFIVKRIWCEKPSRRNDDESVRENELVMTNGGEEVNRTGEELNAYDNLVFDSSDMTVTSM